MSLFAANRPKPDTSLLRPKSGNSPKWQESGTITPSPCVRNARKSRLAVAFEHLFSNSAPRALRPVRRGNLAGTFGHSPGPLAGRTALFCLSVLLFWGRCGIGQDEAACRIQKAKACLRRRCPGARPSVRPTLFDATKLKLAVQTRRAGCARDCEADPSHPKNAGVTVVHPTPSSARPTPAMRCGHRGRHTPDGRSLMRRSHVAIPNTSGRPGRNRVLPWRGQERIRTCTAKRRTRA